MKIVIVSSLSFPKEILKAKKTLESWGHSVFIPPTTMDYHLGKRKKGSVKEDVKAKADVDAIRLYYKKIKETDSILVLNYTKKGVKNYIGANALIEMAFAHVLNKPIYLFNPIPDMDCRVEILHMKPVVLSGNLDLLKADG